MLMRWHRIGSEVMVIVDLRDILVSLGNSSIILMDGDYCNCALELICKLRKCNSRGPSGLDSINIDS